MMVLVQSCCRGITNNMCHGLIFLCIRYFTSTPKSWNTNAGFNICGLSFFLGFGLEDGHVPTFSLLVVVQMSGTPPPRAGRLGEDRVAGTEGLSILCWIRLP